jgi:predicted Rossmann-fold nucleotide-binding protein
LPYKIGVYGSKTTEREESVQLAQGLGRALAQNHVIVITGACSGMPYAVANAAKQQRAEVWGFSRTELAAMPQEESQS